MKAWWKIIKLADELLFYNAISINVVAILEDGLLIDLFDESLVILYIEYFARLDERLSVLNLETYCCDLDC